MTELESGNRTTHMASMDIVPVSELLTRKFFVPKYQRGYRWTTTQVEDLLNDVNSFTPQEVRQKESPPEKTWYCLQPLIVKIREGEHSDTFELIDGQQRITTIFLIVHYINEKWRGDDKDPEPQIDYETRKDSHGFLKDLAVKDDRFKIDDSNIDYHHISEAYKTIHTWVQEQKQKGFKKDQFIDNFLNHVKVIWYETTESDAVNIFTRVNMGKIPLTNAELIKALFLNSSNFGSDDTERIRLQQFEIAGEWDRIEASLHNSEFWYFLNDNRIRFENRIDFLFDILTEKRYPNDPYAVFRTYSEDFKQDEREIKDKWRPITRYHQTLEEWFLDRERYHKIGYLLAIVKPISIKDLIKEAEESSKSKFIKHLDKKIADSIRDDLNELEYGDKSIKSVLLLHNVQTMLNNAKETSRFPFDRYKNEKWDIEHIIPIQDKMPVSRQHRRDWLKDSAQYIEDNELKARVSKALEHNKLDGKIFEQLFQDVMNALAASGYISDINDLSNLALLDAGTNRGFKNAIYPVKREWIIDREKSGTFVPICTKNVFMKFYSSSNVENLTFWSEQDGEAYRKDIESVLSHYMNGGNQ